MFAADTDRDWMNLAARDPYWAVLTDPRYRGTALAADALDEFYDSGERYVNWLFDAIRSDIDTDFEPWTALDFGCGVGRLTMPLARRCGRVNGVDVAEPMLARARERAHDEGVANARFVLGDDRLSRSDGKFDLVHSYIVLQHIRPSRGVAIMRRLIELIAPDGVGALHVTYRGARSSWLGRLRPWLRGLVTPKMQMNAYDLGTVFRMLHDAGARRVTSHLTDHGGCLGALLLFRRESHPVCVI